MKRTLLLTFLLLSVSALCFSQKLVEVAKGYSCTSVNTTIFRNNSLVTHGDEQYISYYDADGYLVLGKRKLNSKQCKRCPQYHQYNGGRRRVSARFF